MDDHNIQITRRTKARSRTQTSRSGGRKQPDQAAANVPFRLSQTSRSGGRKHDDQAAANIPMRGSANIPIRRLQTSRRKHPDQAAANIPIRRRIKARNRPQTSRSGNRKHPHQAAANIPIRRPQHPEQATHTSTQPAANIPIRRPQTSRSDGPPRGVAAASSRANTTATPWRGVPASPPKGCDRPRQRVWRLHHREEQVHQQPHRGERQHPHRKNATDPAKG